MLNQRKSKFWWKTMFNQREKYILEHSM